MIKEIGLVLLLLGDLNFIGLQYLDAFRKAGYDPGFSFSQAVPAIRQADLTIANLEGPLTFADWAPASENKQWRFRQLPVFAAGIRKVGVRVVLLGNNHIADSGDAGIRDTIATLKEQELRYVPPPDEGPLFLSEKGIGLELWNVDIFSVPGSHPWAMTSASFVDLVQKKREQSREGTVRIVFVHDHYHGKATAADRERLIARLRAAGIDWVVFGGDHRSGILRADEHGGVHYGLGDFVFGCECSGKKQGKALILRIKTNSVEAQEVAVSVGDAATGYVTQLGSTFGVFSP